MDVEEVKALKNWLLRIGALDSFNEDLIENAIWCLEHGSKYRAEQSLRTLVANLKNEGKFEAAKAVSNVL